MSGVGHQDECTDDGEYRRDTVEQHDARMVRRTLLSTCSKLFHLETKRRLTASLVELVVSTDRGIELLGDFEVGRDRRGVSRG